MIIISTSNKTKFLFTLSFLFFFANVKSQTYCSTRYYGGNTNGEHISLVKIPNTTLNNTTGAAFGCYKLYPATGSTTATLIRGNNYTLQVAGGYSHTVYITAWADWNRNGVFESNEGIGISPKSDSFNIVSMANGIHVPANAALGNTRLRFRSSINYDIDLIDKSCNYTLSDYGETEDYIITIACQFNTAPSVSFNTNDSVFVKSPTTLLNTSTNFENTKWYINSNYDTNSTNLKHTFNTAGSYNICMKANNCFGNDSNCFALNVYNPTQAPLANLTASNDTTTTFTPITLIDLSTHGPTYWQWSCIPSSAIVYLNGTNANSQNPIVHFTIPGTYQICMWDSNAIGMSNTACINIVVNPNNRLCIYPFESNLKFGTVTDDGGINGNYNSGGICTFLIDACANTVKLKFPEFNLSANSYLRIYNGKNNLAPPLHSGLGFTGTSLPGGTNGLTASSGNFFIEFQKGTSAPGFVATWSTTASTEPPPSGSILGFDTVDYCINAFNIYQYKSNNSSFNYNEAMYSWDVDYLTGNGPAQSFQGLYQIFFIYREPGTHIIRLTVENCGGTEIIYDTIVSIYPTKGPNVKFTISPSTVLVGDTITLTENTFTLPYLRKWSISGPGGFTALQGTDASPIYKIKVSIPGPYSIQLKASNCFAADSLSKTVVVYCAPQVTNLSNEYGLQQFVLNKIDRNTLDSLNILNISNTNSSPQAFINQSNIAIANIGDSIAFRIKRKNANLAADIRIWIDYNRNGSFQANELLASNTNVTGLFYTGSFAIPDTLKSMDCRIRIGTSAAGQANTPCGTNNFGEFDDYLLRIQPSIRMANNIDTFYAEVGRAFITPTYSVFGTSNIIHSGFAFGSIASTYPSIKTHTIFAKEDDEHFTSETLYFIATPDTTKPVITLLGASTVYLEVKKTYNELGAIASDFYFGSLNSALIKKSNIDTSKVGTYYVSYKVKDIAGNDADSVFRTVIIREMNPPVLKLLGKDTVLINVNSLTTVPEPGYTVTDSFYPTSNLIVNANYSSVHLNQIGLYAVRYYASNPSGKIDSSQVRFYNVKDTSAPVITLIGNQGITRKRFKPYVDPGNIVTDNYDKNLICTPDISQVDINFSGIYAVYFNVKDSSGNKAQQVIRFVNIDNSIGIDLIDSNQLFSIYPNPTQGSLNIILNTEEDALAKVQIFDTKGAMVFEKDTKPDNQHRLQVDIGDLAEGFYFVKLQHGNQVCIKTFSLIK